MSTQWQYGDHGTRGVLEPDAAHAAGDGRARRFEVVYGTCFEPVTAFALRRTESPEDAADAVAETFVVVWRRLGEVPAAPADLPWIYGVARKILANQRRGNLRRGNLGAQLKLQLTTTASRDLHQAALDRLATVQALGRLSTGDREVMELAAWEELSAAEIAVVTGSSPVAVRARLSRARKKLRAVVQAADEVSPPGREGKNLS